MFFNMHLPAISNYEKKQTLVNVEFLETSYSTVKSKPFKIESERMADFYEIINFAFDETRLTQFFARLGPFLPGEIKIVPLSDYLKKCLMKKMVTMGFCLPSKKMSNAFFGFNNFETSTIQQTSFSQHFILHIEITDTIMPDPVWPDMYDAGSNESETLVIKVEPNSI